MFDITTNESDEQRIEKWLEWKRGEINENSYSIEYVEKVLNKEINGMPNDVTAFWFRIDEVANESLAFGIYNRIINGDVCGLVNSIYTYGRLEYLTHLFDINGNFIFDFVKAIAVYDKKLINVYIQKKQKLLKKLAPTHINALLNGIYAFLKNDIELKNQSRQEIKSIIKQKTGRLYDKAILKCLDKLLSGDYKNLLEPVNEILSLHNEQETRYNNKSLLNFISIPALAFYNMAYFDPNRGNNPMPPEPSQKYWDSELWHMIIEGKHKPKYVINIEKTSPLLKKWMDELPEKIDLNELVESLK